jgi:hypothetical protein
MSGKQEWPQTALERGLQLTITNACSFFSFFLSFFSFFLFFFSFFFFFLSFFFLSSFFLLSFFCPPRAGAPAAPGSAQPPFFLFLCLLFFFSFLFF